MTGPATTVPHGETPLAELARTHGALTGDTAVFGTTGAATEPVPAWITHWPAIRQRLDRKHPSGLSRTTWWRIAALATQGHQLLHPQPPPHHPPRRALANATRLAGTIARTLPAPPRSLLHATTPEPEPEHYLTRWGPPTGAIEAALSRLCRALDDPTWTDPDALAGWIADAHTALTTYHAALTTRPPRTATREPGHHRTPQPKPRPGTGAVATVPAGYRTRHHR